MRGHSAIDLVLRRETALPHGDCIIGDGFVDHCSNLSELPHEFRGEFCQAEQVFQNEHLPVASAAGADADGGNRQRGGNLGGNILRNTIGRNSYY